MKHLFIIALSLLCIHTHAQKEVAKPANNSTAFKRLYVGVSTTHGVGYRLLVRNKAVPAPDGLEYIEDFTIESRSGREKPDYAMSAGFRLGANLSKMVSVETGFDYARTGYKYKMDNLQFGPDDQGNFPSSTGWAKFEDVYHYLDIPLAVNLKFGSKKVRALVSTGTYLNVLLRKNTRTEYEAEGHHGKGVREDRSPFARFNISPFLGIGIDYKISSLMSLRVMPMAQFQALHNVKGTPITEHLYSGGINVALNFGFVEAKAVKK